MALAIRSRSGIRGCVEVRNPNIPATGTPEPLSAESALVTHLVVIEGVSRANEGHFGDQRALGRGPSQWMG